MRMIVRECNGDLEKTVANGCFSSIRVVGSGHDARRGVEVGDFGSSLRKSIEWASPLDRATDCCAHAAA